MPQPPFLLVRAEKMRKKQPDESLLCAIETFRHRRFYEMIDPLYSQPFLMSKTRKWVLTGVPSYPPTPSLRRRTAWPPTIQLRFSVSADWLKKGNSPADPAMKGVPAECLIVRQRPPERKAADLAGRRRMPGIRFLTTSLFPAGRNHSPRSHGHRPSIWHENNPFSIIESFSLGTPVWAPGSAAFPRW